MLLRRLRFSAGLSQVVGPLVRLECPPHRWSCPVALVGDSRVLQLLRTAATMPVAVPMPGTTRLDDLNREAQDMGLDH